MDSIPWNEPGFRLDEDKGGMLINAMIALIVLSTMAVALRLLSRKVSGAGFWWDDVLVVAALILSFVGPMINIIGVKQSGMGQHIWRFGANGKNYLIQILQEMWIFQIFFALATGAIKMCMLTFYRRIFPLPGVRKVLYILSAITLAFTVGVVLLSIFQCTPVSDFWSADVHSHNCVNTKDNLLVTGAINTTLDFIIVFLPVPLLWTLRTSTAQKLLLTSIFLLASFIVVVSILRLTSFTVDNTPDVTFVSVPVCLWSAIEPCMGVVGACVTSMRPLAVRFFRLPPILKARLPRSNWKSRAESAIPWLMKDPRSGSWDQRQSRRGSTMSTSGPDSLAGRLESVDEGVVGLQLQHGMNPFSAHYKFDGTTDTYRSKIEAFRIEEVEVPGVPMGEIRVQTDIRLSVMPRCDYDYRIF